MPPRKPPPEFKDFDPDTEPQAYIGGFDPWRELQPEHEKVLEQQLEMYEQKKAEIAQLVASVFSSGRGPELLELLTVMAKACPRDTYEQVLRRDSKLDFVDWIDSQIRRAMNL